MKSLDDFSTEEKIEIFNEVYKMSCLGKTIFKEINE
jgi:hypothetical protein